MLKKFLPLFVLGSIIATLLVACGASTGNTASAASTGNTVHMNSSAFIQPSITIKKGASVTLVDDDNFIPHVIANGSWENGSAQAGSESNAPKVNNLQVNGGSQAVIGPFTVVGIYHYYCTIHSDMNLTVIVTA